MKKLFLITSLVIALTFGGGTNGLAGPKGGHVHTDGTVIVASVSIEDVECTCGCGGKAIECLCGTAIKALNDAGFSMEDIEEYLKNARI